MGRKRRKCTEQDSEEDFSSVYDGFCPLWDRKWLFEDDLWIFPKGMRDMQFDEYDAATQTAKRRQALVVRTQATEAKYALVENTYQTRSRAVHRSSDSSDSDSSNSDSSDSDCSDSDSSTRSRSRSVDLDLTIRNRKKKGDDIRKAQFG